MAPDTQTPAPESPLDLKESIERQDASLARQLDWIRAVDGKTPIIIGIDTAMLAAIVAIAAEPTKFTAMAGLMVVLGSGAVIISLVCCIAATFPRTDGPEGSLIYFGSINNQRLDQYDEAIRQRSDAEYLTDLNAQCHRNAQIAASKYAAVTNAMMWLFIALPLWLIAGYMLYQG